MQSNDIKKSSHGFRYDLLGFCETYFKHYFYVPWTEEQLAFIRKVESAILQNGFEQEEMPRGSGKTTIVIVAGIWAWTFRHVDNVKYVSRCLATGKHRMKYIAKEISRNDKYQELLKELGKEAEVFSNKLIIHDSKGDRGRRIIFGSIQQDNREMKIDDLVIFDDVHTTASEHSDSQTAVRLKMIEDCVHHSSVCYSFSTVTGRNLRAFQ